MSTKYAAFFFYSSLLLAVFFLFQIRYTLDFALEDWSFPQYALLSLLFMFLLLCCLRYYHYQTVLTSGNQSLKSQASARQVIKQKLLSMDPAALEELITKLFQASGTSKVFSTPKANDPFYDIEMNLNDQKVFISCVLKEQSLTISQADLNRLYELMKSNEISQGAFITLGEFSQECYEFTKDKPIYLINGEDLLDSLNMKTDTLYS